MSEHVVEEAPGKVAAIWAMMRLLLTGAALMSGVFMSSCGALMTAHHAVMLPRGASVRDGTGTVVRFEQDRVRNRGSSPDSIVYFPVVRFEYDGQVREFRGRDATGKPPWSVGQGVTVRVDPRHPDRPELMGWETWSLALSWLAQGLVFLAMGVVLWRRRWWTRPGLW